MARGGKRPGAGRPKGSSDELYRRVTLTLSPRTLERVDDYAAASGLTRSAAVEKLMMLGLEKLFPKA
jgi:hypothetical protein